MTTDASVPTRPVWARRLLRAESTGDAVFKAVTGFFAVLVLVAFAAVLVILVQKSMPSLRAFGASFLWSERWDPPGQHFGALPYIFGTVASSIIALCVAVPVAIGSAVSLTSLLPRAISRPAGLVIELLAAVPSIVFGVWALAVILPVVRFVGPPGTTGYSLLAGGLILGVMVLPILAAISRDMLHAVPSTQTEAALALGATKWEVIWRVVLPNARSGLVAAVILGFGRAFGETMAVIMVIGNQARIPHSPFEPSSTMASVIANEFGDPSGPLHTSSLVELGLILLVVSLALSVLSRTLVRALARRFGGAP